MTRKQRIDLWRKISKCFHHHEMKMIEQHKKDKRPDYETNYYEPSRRKDYEPDATSMDDDLPEALTDSAKAKRNFEL